MKRLLQGSGKNLPRDYDAIYYQRQKKGIDWADLRRWKYLLKYYQGGNILDIGCLDSQIGPLTQNYLGAYIGIDLASLTIEEMQKKYGGGRTFYEVIDCYDLDFEDGCLDYVVMGELIEHLEKPVQAINEAVRVLKPGGVLAVSTPLEETPGDVDFDRHLWSFSKQDMIDVLKNYGQVKIKVLRSRGIPYLPGYKYCHMQLLAFLFKK